MKHFVPKVWTGDYTSPMTNVTIPESPPAGQVVRLQFLVPDPPSLQLPPPAAVAPEPSTPSPLVGEMSPPPEPSPSSPPVGEKSPPPLEPSSSAPGVQKADNSQTARSPVSSSAGLSNLQYFTQLSVPAGPSEPSIPSPLNQVAHPYQATTLDSPSSTPRAPSQQPSTTPVPTPTPSRGPSQGPSHTHPQRPSPAHLSSPFSPQPLPKDTPSPPSPSRPASSESQKGVLSSPAPWGGLEDGASKSSLSQTLLITEKGNCKQDWDL